MWADCGEYFGRSDSEERAPCAERGTGDPQRKELAVTDGRLTMFYHNLL